jgi:serine/threonine protein kinase
MEPAVTTIQPSVGGNWSLKQAKYDERDVIGEGAMAVVYSGKYKDQDVAIKIMREYLKSSDPQLLEAFDREAELSASCSHDNVVRVLGFNKEEKALCMGKLFSLPLFVLNFLY